jgi:hypothetical protein
MMVHCRPSPKADQPSSFNTPAHRAPARGAPSTLGILGIFCVCFSLWTFVPRFAKVWSKS